MINSKEALISSQLHRNNTIENYIYDACRVGKTNAHLTPRLSDKEVTKLNKLGYVVTHSRDHDFSTIWWGTEINSGNLSVVGEAS